MLEERDNKRLELIQTPNEDEKNAIKAEIKNIENRLEKILGKKEFDRLEELKNKNGRKEKKVIDNYNKLKEKLSAINPFNVASKRTIITANSKTKEIEENNVLKKVA